MTEAELLEKQRAGDEDGEPRLSYPEIDRRLRLLMGSPLYHLPHEEVEAIADALWMIRTQARDIERFMARLPSAHVATEDSVLRACYSAEPDEDGNPVIRPMDLRREFPGVPADRLATIVSAIEAKGWIEAVPGGHKVTEQGIGRLMETI